MYKGLLLSKIIVVLFFTLSSCNQGSNTPETNSKTESEEPDSLIKSGKVFLLPAPLQVASIIREADAPYSEMLLIEPYNGKNFRPSNEIKCFLLGGTIIDLGYSTVYGQGQKGLQFIQAIKNLGEELNISSLMDAASAKRFEKNIDHKDSLYTIILESYNKAHSFFRDNQREKDGALILAGSYIESSYLLLSLFIQRPDRKYLECLRQHRSYLKNLMGIVEHIEPDDQLHTLYKQLHILNEAYESSSKYQAALESEDITELASSIQPVLEKLKECRSYYYKS